MIRPPRAPDLLATLEAAVSARIARRVKENPALAEAWAWSATEGGVEVRAEDVIVRIAGALVHPAGLSCTCLMAPKCVHVLAVAAALPEVGAGEPPAAPTAAPEPAAPSPGAAPLPGPTAPPPHAPVALRASAALATLLHLGAHAADVVVRADLSRAAYEARSAGLHRLGRALTRVVRSLRLLEAGHPTFALATLVEEVGEALDVARRLRASDAPDLYGEARRTYSAVGTLRLYGLCCEPVLAGTGHAGVVTWFLDARGRRWHVSDVRPRAAGQAVGVYEVAPPVTTIPHRKLCREGLFVQGATAAGGRLGAGGGVAAVRAGGAEWGAEPMVAAWTSGGRPSNPADADDLRFLTGVVRGLWRDALVLHTDGGDVFVLPGSEHASLPWRDNLRLLARAPGLVLSLVGRDAPARPRAVVGIAVASAIDTGEGPRLLLPPEWSGRVNLGLDRLTTAHLPRCAPEPVRLDGDAPDPGDPLSPLRRRVARALLGGVSSLPGDARLEVVRDATRLRGHLATGAAELLVALADAANAPRSRRVFSDAWLASALYLAAADRERARRAWV